jgi:hypothetical protein
VEGKKEGWRWEVEVHFHAPVLGVGTEAALRWVEEISGDVCDAQKAGHTCSASARAFGPVQRTDYEVVVALELTVVLLQRGRGQSSCSRRESEEREETWREYRVGKLT